MSAISKIKSIVGLGAKGQSPTDPDLDPNSGAVGEPTLLSQFRQATLVLMLLAAVNSEGRHVLNLCQDDDSNLIPASLERTQSTDQLVMNALSILLVRKHEIVAVTSATSPGREHVSPPDINLHDLAAREASPQNLPPTGSVDFIAIRNPEWTSSKQLSSSSPWAQNPEADYMVLPEGTSRWKNISQNPYK